MLCHGTRDLALLARVFKYSKCFISSRQINQKFVKGEKMKRLRKEDKMFFGKLIETKREKDKRLKNELSGQIKKTVPSTANSELTWILGSSISIEKLTKSLPKDQKLSLNSNQICDSKQVPKPETINSVSSTEESKMKEILLSKKIVQNMLEFPVFDTEKSFNDKWTDESKIMTVSPMKDRACLKYPSVTKILTATMSEEAKAVLEKWKQSMIQKYGYRGFELYQQELLDEGKSLHSTIMNKLSGKPYEIPTKVQQAYNSLNKVFEDVGSVRALESHVIHPTLMYRGIVDCVAVYRKKLCLIDWKKSDKLKEKVSATYDAPLQLASYIGALNADVKYPFQIKAGIIIVAYTSGKPANVHEINEEDLQKYWKLWLQRLQNYHVSLNPT